MSRPAPMASGGIHPREASARDEWMAQWPLPVVAMLGIAGSATSVYSAGVFLSMLTVHFGWSRGATSSAFLIQTVLSLGAVPLVGRLIDARGPRRVATIGLAAMRSGSVVAVHTTGCPTLAEDLAACAPPDVDVIDACFSGGPEDAARGGL